MSDTSTTGTVVEPISTTVDGFAGAHPRGLYTLFFTEMWERFSYYGMRALLVLFMTSAVAEGGMAFTDQVSTAIYGIYTAAVYLVALPGGWIADRLLGAQRSVWYGGIVIMSGHFVLAIPTQEAFFLGLVLVVVGTGLLKPNISAIVGELYAKSDARRDAGFTIFYMGINLGAILGPLICSYLGENVNWHYGFAAAGVGMFLGLIQYRLTKRHLGEAGLHPSHRPTETDTDAARHNHTAWIVVWIVVGIISLTVVTGLAGMWTLNPVAVAQGTTYVIVGFAVFYFLYMFTLAGLDTEEKKRTAVIAILFVSAAVFWSGFEQAGSSMNLFAERYTHRVFFGWEIPTGWFQVINPVFIIILAPFFAALWVRLGVRNLDPSIPAKFGFGLLLLGVGFLVMVAASKLVVAGNTVLPTWLLFAYLLHTTGELCLSPVGLSSVTKLAPHRFVGQMMGVWFLGASLGNLIAGLLAGRFDPESIQQMPSLYMQIVLTSVGLGLLMLVFTRPIRRLIGDVR